MTMKSALSRAFVFVFFFQAEDGIRDHCVTGVQTCALPILTKFYRTYRKERGLWGSIKGLIRRRYDETRAADHVSFQIEEGEFVGFLGPNGARSEERRVGKECRSRWSPYH